MSKKDPEAGGNCRNKQIFLPHRTGMFHVFAAQGDESFGVIEASGSTRVQEI